MVRSVTHSRRRASTHSAIPLLAHLRKHHQARLQSHTDEEVKEYISVSCVRAGRLYGLRTEQALACYAEIPLLLGDEFEVNPAYRTVVALLGQQSFEPNTRAKMAASWWAFERAQDEPLG